MSTPYPSANNSDPQTETLQERVDTLSEEIGLAVKWNRPSILLAVYRSALVCAQAQWMLAQQVSKMGQALYHLTINTDDFDIPMFLSRYPGREHTVFFVKGLKLAGRREGYHAYRALNIRRELLVDHRIRVVFWLSENEAADLPGHAPDFWVFRHRVIEFLDPPADQNITAITTGPILAEADGQSQARFDDLLKALEKAARLEPGRVVLWASLGEIYQRRNRTGDALRAFRKATRLQPRDAHLWLMLGDLYRGEKRLREAKKAYLAALEIDPHNRQAQAALALCVNDAL